MNKRVIILILVLMIILTFIILVSSQAQKTNTPLPVPKYEPTATPITQITQKKVGVGEEYSLNQIKADEAEKPILDKMAKIIIFKDSLPFKGTYSSLEFNIQKGKYILTIDKNNIPQGQSEHDNLLNKYGVDKQYMSDRLVTNYR